MEELITIKELISQGDVLQAIRQLDALLAVEKNFPCKDQAYYLRGNAYRKQGDWQQALNNYSMAADLNPESPACNAKQMLLDILEFYNKDMYNQ